ncbi:hypothetical protein PLESTB_001595000 [Pleodorina starrii]|uniref:AB hydrolase-1 domain-containing protein n=1 Tax=Pleodorina starrii TaxID=330485 RepID=A0A9W6BZC0_9CHLO|nr:hypothetical protein PLESTB_001595000 [Pleodorina starrii]
MPTSQVSLALVVAATAALPPAVALSLACCELAFAASAAVRFSAHSSPAGASAANRRKGAASSIRLPGFGRLSKQTNAASHFGDSAAHIADSLKETLASGCSHAEQVADKLFDEREGHLQLLSGGQLLSQWFNGLAGPHQLHLSHVTQLLAYLLLPYNQHNYHNHHNQGTAQPVPGVAATAAEAGEHSSASAPEQADAAGPDGAAVPCPRIRSWASRLMELVHHQPQQQLQQQQQHSHNGQPQVSQPSAVGGAAATATTTAAAANANAAKVKLLACTADPLVASYRPLVFYLLTEAVAAATHIALKLMGFRATATPNGTATIYTWLPPASDNTSATASPATNKGAGGTAGADGGDDDPLVFLHGIGLGLTPYLRLLGRLVAASGGRRPVYAVQYKHVSMRLTTTIPAPHEVATDVADFLAARGVTRMSLLAHSYGTLVASALTKLAAASSAAPAISRLTLVDPVCFAMFLPHLVRNAIYQQPLTHEQGEQGEQLQEHPFSRRRLLRSLIKGLVVAEFHCSVALRRRLDWARVNLWPSELPPQCAVVLSGRDNLVPVREVAAILARRAALLGPSAPQPSVLLREDLGHGGFLADDDCQADVMAAALGCTRRTAKEVINATATETTSLSVAPAQAGGRGRLPLGPLVAPPARQVPPVVSLADRGVLAAGPTIAIEALQAVWSQHPGAFFVGSAIVTRSATGGRGGVPEPAVPADTTRALSHWRSAAFRLPWPLLSLLIFAGPQPKFPLAAAVLMALAALSSEDGVIGPEGGGGASSGGMPRSEERTHLALLAIVGFILEKCSERSGPYAVWHMGSQLPPLQCLPLQQHGAARKPSNPQLHHAGSRTAPVAYLPSRALRPVAALRTAPMPVIRVVRWPASGATGGAIGRVRR